MSRKVSSDSTNVSFFLSQTMAIEPMFINSKRSGSLIDKKYLDEVVQECTTIMQVFDRIKCYYSWFNYTLIDQIFEMFCSRDRDFGAEYQGYKQKFKAYCSNRLCRVPKSCSTFGNPRYGTKTFVFKVDKKWRKIKISQISKIKASICKIFRIKSGALFLRSARKGCVELLFDIPDFIAELILPTTLETEGEALCKAGILNVSPCSYTGKKLLNTILLTLHAKYCTSTITLLSYIHTSFKFLSVMSFWIWLFKCELKILCLLGKLHRNPGQSHTVLCIFVTVP